MVQQKVGSIKVWRAHRGLPNIKFNACLTRVYTAPSQLEYFYLRLLLHDVAGPTTFQDFRVIGIEYQTFREACFYF